MLGDDRMFGALTHGGLDAASSARLVVEEPLSQRRRIEICGACIAEHEFRRAERLPGGIDSVDVRPGFLLSRDAVGDRRREEALEQDQSPQNWNRARVGEAVHAPTEAIPGKQSLSAPADQCKAGSGDK